MTIQYASDLHLEFADNWRYLKENPLQVTGDILILAGDIGYLGDENYSKHPFWDWASENYQQVIICMGNHEFYKYYDIAKLNDGFCLEIRPNVHSYYNAVVRIEDIDFIVTTLWSKIPLKEAYYTEQVRKKDRCHSSCSVFPNAMSQVCRQSGKRSLYRRIGRLYQG